MTHRDIAEVIPSVADVYLELSSAYSDAVDRRWLAEVNTGWCERGMRRMIAFRERGNDVRFHDIRFTDFQADPIGEIERLYAWLGEPLSPETWARMQAWREATPRDKVRVHRHGPEEFGIDLARLREHFRFYSERFGLA